VHLLTRTQGSLRSSLFPFPWQICDRCDPNIDPNTIVQHRQTMQAAIVFTYQWCRAPDNFSLAIVLGSMTRANKLVLSRVPWHHTTKMCAHSIDSICCKSSVILYNEVCRISLPSEQEDVNFYIAIILNEKICSLVISLCFIAKI